MKIQNQIKTKENGRGRYIRKISVLQGPRRRGTGGPIAYSPSLFRQPGQIQV